MRKDSTAHTFSDVLVAVFLVAHQHVVLVLVLAVGRPGVVVVVVVRLVLGLPRHLVLLLQPPPGVGEPRADLRERHLCDDGQHDLLALGRVRVLLVLVEPRLERGRRLPGGVLPPGRQVVSRAVPAEHTETDVRSDMRNTGARASAERV